MLPIYLGMMLFSGGMIARLPPELRTWQHFARPIAATAATAFVCWLNGVTAVVALRKDRAELLGVAGDANSERE